MNSHPPDTSMSRSQAPHTAYILQPPTNPSMNSSRNRIRDRKQQSTLRQGQKSTSTSNTMLDDPSQSTYQLTSSSSTAHMRSLDRRHVRATPHNSSINSTTNTNPLKSSHNDIYGSLERNKHSKVSQPMLHGTILNDENNRNLSSDHQAHDFYHLTSTVPPSSSTTRTTSTVVNVGNVLQQQGSFDQIDSIPPPIPPSIHRTRRAPPLPTSVFQPHFESSTSTTPKDSYYTISGSKDVSSHPHPHHIRGIFAEHSYVGSYPNKPPLAPHPPSLPPPSTQQHQHQHQQQSMHRYDTSPLLVRRLDHNYQPQGPLSQQPTHIPRYPPQSYNRTQSSSMMTTSQPTMERINTAQPSALLFRPHSSQSSSSQSSGYL